MGSIKNFFVATLVWMFWSPLFIVRSMLEFCGCNWGSKHVIWGRRTLLEGFIGFKVWAPGTLLAWYFPDYMYQILFISFLVYMSALVLVCWFGDVGDEMESFQDLLN